VQDRIASLAKAKAKMKFKILFLQTLASGTAYYRMFNFVKYMRKDKGVQVAFYPYFDKEKNTVAIWESELQNDKVHKEIMGLVECSDIIVMQKIHTPLGLAFMKMITELYPLKHIIMETDDDFTAVDPSSPSYRAYNPGSDYEWWNTQQLQSASHVITSTDYLKERFSKYNKNITVIPNAIDFELWDKAREGYKKHKRVRIGWMGSCTHFKDLEMIKEALETVLERHKNAEVYMVGYDPMIFNHPRIIIHNKWSNIMDYPQFVGKYSFDIGIAPLRDSIFNRAKSNLRYIEYSALQIPTVASDVMPMKCIKSDKTGILVENNTAKWVEALSALIIAPERRSLMGMAAYHYVKHNLNAKTVAKQYIRVLRDLQENKQ
jgi:glycosyltransferase involved in cell wall biosynthesis